MFGDAVVDFGHLDLARLGKIFENRGCRLAFIDPNEVTGYSMHCYT